MADANGTSVENDKWGMGDVQRALALILVVTFALTLLVLIIRLVIWGDPPTLVDLVKTLVSALINVVMLVLGYFYGSSKAKEQSDTSQQRVVEKLTSPPPAGPVAPVPSPAAATVVVSWWSLMQTAEKAAIEAAKADPKIAAVLARLESGKAEAPDLVTLVDAGLLTQARADTISGKV